MQRIMVVDDEALVLFDLVMTVEDLGYEVFCDSISVPDALACLEGGTPDAALLDIDVGGTLVWPVARVLKDRGCPIAFVSANRSHAELEGEFSEARFIDKPASSDQIAAMIDTLLAGSDEGPRLAVGQA